MLTYVAAAFELKLKAPDGLSINAKGTSPHSGAISSSVSLPNGSAMARRKSLITFTHQFEAKKVIAKGTTLFHISRARASMTGLKYMAPPWQTTVGSSCIASAPWVREFLSENVHEYIWTLY